MIDFTSGLKKSTIIIFLFVLPSCCFSIDICNKKDSLLSVLKTQKEDTTKVNTLNNLSNELRGSNPDSALLFANKAYALAIQLKYINGQIDALTTIANINRDQSNLEISIKFDEKALVLSKVIGDKACIATSYNNIGIAKKIQSNYDEALKYYNLALNLRKEVGDKKAIAETYNQLGSLCFSQAKYNDALKYYESTLKIREQLGMKTETAISLNNIGAVYSDQGYYDKAIENYYRSLKILEKLDNLQLLSIMYSNIGNVLCIQNKYNEALQWYNKSIEKSIQGGNKHSLADCYNKVGTLYGDMDDYKKELEYHLKSLKIKIEIGDKKGMGESYNNIGVSYRNVKDYDNALQNFYKALEIKEEINDKKGLVNAYSNIGYILSLQKKNKEAIVYLSKGQDLAKQLGVRKMLKDNYYMFFELYNNDNNPAKALEYYMKWSALKDSLLSERTLNLTEELKAKYESEKKNNEILMLKNQKQLDLLTINQQREKVQNRNLSIILIVVFVLIFSLIMYLFIQRRNTKRKLIHEKKLLMVEEAERLRIAKDIHDELGSGLSKIALISEYSKQYVTDQQPLNANILSISNTTKELIGNMHDLVWALNSENSSLDNLMAHIIEFSSDFLEDFPIQKEFNFPDEIPDLKISKEAQRNIFMTCKETLNNTVKHAGADMVIITAVFNDDSFFISIKDNGKGFDKSAIKKSGNGLNNMKHRIEAIKGRFKIESEINTGTLTEISVDYKNILPLV